MRAETSVVREHEEFLWLHSVLDENESYAGFIVPPAPPRPDFDSSREKLQKLGEGEATMTKEEFLKMKQELEQTISPVCVFWLLQSGFLTRGLRSSGVSEDSIPHLFK
ncbi:hypothetical protein OSTOST_22651, partial [Ostertagia ostertagi]